MVIATVRARLKVRDSGSQVPLIRGFSSGWKKDKKGIAGALNMTSIERSVFPTLDGEPSENRRLDAAVPAIAVKRGQL